MERLSRVNIFLILIALAGFAVIIFITMTGGDSPILTKNKDTDKRIKSYVALGDSIAAGLGLPLDPAASTEDTACGRSPAAYAFIAGQGIKEKLPVTNLACQQAVTGNLTSPQSIKGTDIKPQLEAAFAAGTPKVMSLTVGANDVEWAAFIGACLQTTCDTRGNTERAAKLTAAMKDNLAAAMSEIEARSQGTPPALVVTGYFQPMSDSCAIVSALTPGELRWVREQTDLFNSAIQAGVANYSFASFAPIDFNGHDICSADPWIQRPGEPAPFHPNTKGHQAMARAILKSLEQQ